MTKPIERRWYVVHTYSGYEHKVKAALEERIRSMSNPERFGEILVPSEQVVELVKGKKKTSSRKFFPGYILVNMHLDKETWHIIKSTPKVTGFVGGATDPESIPPISEAEVREITHQMEEGAVKPKPKVLFEQGEQVKVIDGPFQDFNGVVEEVKPDKGKLRVLISIFGRATPVELDFVQVEKA
jgi:transcriptional antiterminator NusG